MKPFDLEAAKRGEPIITKQGGTRKFHCCIPEARPLERIVCTDIGGKVWLYAVDGRWSDRISSDHDLIMVPPPMRSINGHKYPEPERVVPKPGTQYHIACATSINLGVDGTWQGTNIEYQWLKRGLIHLTREASEAHARAIILAGGGEI